MRIIFIVLFMGIFKLAFSQVQQVEIYYEGPDKTLKERYTVKKTNPPVIDGPYISYYINGNIKTKGTYTNNIPTGIWEYYYELGKLKMSGEVTDKEKNGFWKYYYENGYLHMEGNLVNGEKQGHWKFYYENGTLKSEGELAANKKEGEWIYYNEDGTVKAKGDFQSDKGLYQEFYASGTVKMEGIIIGDKSDSTWRYYYENGKLKATGPEKEGVKTGFWQFYYPDGTLLSEGNYQDGQTMGIWKYYHENGKLRATGTENAGVKEGTWKLYYPSGEIKGEGNFTKGEGFYKEFYQSGKLKLEGYIKEGENHGLWKYYDENDGHLEGECEFVRGEGLYKGYYKDGSLKMQGTLRGENRVGTWTLYKTNGEIAGYYQAFYEDNILSFKLIEPTPSRKDSSRTNPNLPYQKPPLRIQKQKSRYFRPKVNEYRTFIAGINPVAPVVGSLPFSLEYYIRERLGYELKYTIYRKPFFSTNANVELDKVYENGFSIDLKQKFYQPDRELGMLYFAHEIRFTYKNHKANVIDFNKNPAQGRTLRAPETLYEYSMLVGNRWMRNPGLGGFTVDIFGGIGIGYRNYQQKWHGNAQWDRIFDDTKKNKFVVPLRLGASIGYAF